MKDLQGDNLPTIAEAIKFRMEQYGHNLRQMSRVTGILENHLSEVVNGKISVSRAMQWKLYQYGIPPVVLIQPKETND